ncbi:hypothetical protein LRP30_36860 [Bradyrhizobium sp. C-145]|uniref:hypothetical protein n=1 Tax=Bradyrhizobium sp. C-145 TaxID=574727 RepID=UPI00201B764E|nr:hypothetical protein [Bradyrhizobium sp. C-145]UQR62288.1 hypothetical protein LRP30_36860 [Bradyrhizobium sp. C-145]
MAKEIKQLRKQAEKAARAAKVAADAEVSEQLRTLARFPKPGRREIEKGRQEAQESTVMLT